MYKFVGCMDIHFEKYKEFFFELVKLVVISSAIILPIRFFLIQPFYVKGASMENSFYDREYLIIDEISYRFNEPERGDVVVFKYPKDPSQYFIKRVVGLPGETIQIRNGFVFVKNDTHPEGTLLEEGRYLDLEELTYPEMELTLSPEEYFVLGDNRNSSLDSRVFGALHREYVVGRAWLRGWPLDRVGSIPHTEYTNGL